MSNNYTQFSIALKVKNAELVDEVIQYAANIEDLEFLTDDHGETVSTPSCFDQEDIDFLSECVDQWGGIGGWQNQNNELWVYAEEAANLDAVSFILQKLLIADAIDGNYKDGIIITWANTCSKMRPDEFSGGACYVTKDDIHWQPNVVSWVDGLLNFK